MYEILKPQLKRQIKAVLFDMDGLVLDSEKLYSRFWGEALEELGCHMSRQQLLGMRSLNGQKAQDYLDACFGPGIDYYEAREIRIRRMDAWVKDHGIAPKPGIYELLDCIEALGLSCAIASSSPLDRIEAHLKPLGLYSRFDALCSGYEVKNGKPDPDIYLYAASRLGVRPEFSIALEDSPAGIESAFRAGCLPVIIPDQDQPSEDCLKLCFGRADSLSDLCPLLPILK